MRRSSMSIDRDGRQGPSSRQAGGHHAPGHAPICLSPGYLTTISLPTARSLGSSGRTRTPTRTLVSILPAPRYLASRAGLPALPPVRPSVLPPPPPPSIPRITPAAASAAPSTGSVDDGPCALQNVRALIEDGFGCCVGWYVVLRACSRGERVDRRRHLAENEQMHAVDQQSKIGARTSHLVVFGLPARVFKSIRLMIEVGALHMGGRTLDLGEGSARAARE